MNMVAMREVFSRLFAAVVVFFRHITATNEQQYCYSIIDWKAADISDLSVCY